MSMTLMGARPYVANGRKLKVISPRSRACRSGYVAAVLFSHPCSGAKCLFVRKQYKKTAVT